MNILARNRFLLIVGWSNYTTFLELIGDVDHLLFQGRSVEKIAKINKIEIRDLENGKS